MYVAHIPGRMGDWGNIETAIHFFSVRIYFIRISRLKFAKF